jgi:hypothetical protein
MSERPSPNAAEGYRIFFSYSRKDTGIAKLMIERMEREVAGIEVFFDVRRIEGGDPVPAVIRETIKGCRELLVLLSVNSLKSSWVRIEVAAAWGRERRIVPINYDVTPRDVRDILPIIADLDVIMLADFEEYITQLSRRVKEGQG